MQEGKYYYSLKTHQVVTAGQERAEDVLGPFATRAEAEQAIKHAQDRNEAWDNDPRFNDDEADEDATRADGSPIDK